MKSPRSSHSRPRFHANRMMTPKQAMRRLEHEGILPMRSVINAVAGSHVRGSWWSHPKGREVLRISTMLEDSPDVLVTKLVDGKVTFVHRSLWPPLLRVVTDRGWRRRASRALNPLARRLLSYVERRRSLLRIDKLRDQWRLTDK